jgi:cystathionine beta-lyase
MDLEQVARGLARCQALLLCNPHNPTGRVLTRAELEHIAQVCLEHDVLIVSDEIHCDLVFDGRRHIPIASLSETVARRTITLMAASKTYNVAGLKAAFAVIADPDLRQRFNASRLGMVDSVNALGLVATGAAYRHGGAWKAAVLAYLQDNRDYLFDAVQRRLPGVSMAKPQATFLAWLDCSGLGLNDPQAFFLEHAKVGLNPGTDFGPGGAQHVRLNFGCPRATLEEGLNRLEQSLARRAA